MLAKRAVSIAATSRPATGIRSSVRVPARSGTRRGDWRPRTRRWPRRSPASQNQPVARKNAADRDQRLREPRQRLPALLVDRDDLRHDVGQQHRDHRERDDRHQRRVDERQRELLPQRLARLEIVGEAREHVGQPAGFGADRDEPAIEVGKRPRPARERAGERFARGDLRAQARRTPSPTRGSSACSATAASAWSSGMPERVSVASSRVTSASERRGKARALDRARVGAVGGLDRGREQARRRGAGRAPGARSRRRAAPRRDLPRASTAS